MVNTNGANARGNSRSKFISLFVQYFMEQEDIFCAKDKKGKLRFYEAAPGRELYIPLAEEQVCRMVQAVYGWKNENSALEETGMTESEFYSCCHEVISYPLNFKEIAANIDKRILANAQEYKRMHEEPWTITIFDPSSKDEHLPHYIRRARGGARFIHEAYFLLEIPVEVAGFHKQIDGHQWRRTTCWQAECLYCLRVKKLENKSLFIEFDGPKFCCMANGKAWSLHSKKDLTTEILKTMQLNRIDPHQITFWEDYQMKQSRN